MKFGRLAVATAEGAILAHSVKAGAGLWRKGIRLSGDDCAALAAAGIVEVIAARLDPAIDAHEDAAATRLAAALTGAGLRADQAATGRVNLFADAAGLLLVEADRIDAFNRIDPGITLATLPRFAPMEAGRMAATVKIIPFAVPEGAVAAALAVIGTGSPLRVAAFQPRRVAVVSTRLPALKESVIDKTLAVLARRLALSASNITADVRVEHTVEAVAAALSAAAPVADICVVFGASAVTDIADVIPAGLVAAGGAIRHFGMPVDPGNLLLLGDLNGRPVIGAPGCARSPQENGFDWVLRRLIAGLPVGADDLTALGVGGLLSEIVSRPRPREIAVEAASPPRAVAALVLAAGRSSRMGGPNKLLATLDGEPLVRRAAVAALASGVRETVVVTGHQAAAVRAALAGLPVRFIHNENFAAGLSTSVTVGLAGLGEEIGAAVMVLGDMPRVTAAMIDRLIAVHDPVAGALIAVSMAEGERGNPVLWSRRLFPALMAGEGDSGGRRLFALYPEAVVEVEQGAAAALDADTPEALAALGAVIAPSPPAQ